MMGLLCVGAGGALGAMGRYGLGLIPLGSELPLMTLLITTFSTFSLETLELIEGGQYAIAGAYALVSVVLCVAGVLVGKVLARALMPTG